jgi:hypothetical protein
VPVSQTGGRCVGRSAADETGPLLEDSANLRHTVIPEVTAAGSFWLPILSAWTTRNVE